MKRKRKGSVAEAIERLAALFPYGALEAATMPVVFINHVCDEIEALRNGEDPPERCESGCAGVPVTHHDSEGVPLCEACWKELVDDAPLPAETPQGEGRKP